MQAFWTVLAIAPLALVGCDNKPTAAVRPPAVAASSAPASASDRIIVKIGHAGPLSGPSAHLGKDNENGVRLAIEDLNAKTIKIGGKVATFELLAEDDGGDPRQGTAVAQKLIDSKVDGVIGHMNSGVTIPASKLYSEAGIPQISPSSTNPKYTRQGFKTAFRVLADDTQLGGSLGRYAVQTIKGQKIVVIDDRTAYGQGVAEEFEKAVKAGGGTVAAHEFTTEKATDFNAILTKLKGVSPDVVFFGGMDSVGGPMLRQMKQLGMQAKFMGGDGICTAEMVKLAGDAVGNDQVVCAESGGVEGAFKQGLQDFKARYKTKFGVDVQIYAPYGYDAMNALAQAMVQAGSSEPAKYLPEVGKVHFDGITGPIAFDEKGDLKDGAMTFYTYRSGAREAVAVVR